MLADEERETLTVKNVSAINSQTDPDKVIDAIVHADIVTTAIGPTILPFIAGIVADGLKQRLEMGGQSLNIIACENMIGGSTLLKEKVYEKLTAEEQAAFDQHFGFPDAAVDRIVPNQSNEDKLMVVVEPFYEWVVDQSKLIGEKPSVQGILFVDNLEPYIERKLFTVNTGHAITAYSGYAAGISAVDKAVQNAEIKALVEGALNETGAVLVKKHGFKLEEHQKYSHKILNRFQNPYISDEVTRVGRSPIRKLGSNDRLVAPAEQYLSLVGKEPIYLAKGIAATLHFDFAEDKEAVELQKTIREKGLDVAIRTYTELDPGSPLGLLITYEYQALLK